MKRKLLKFTAGVAIVSVFSLNVKAALGDPMESNFDPEFLDASKTFDDWDSSSNSSGSSTSNSSSTSGSSTNAGGSGSSAYWEEEHPKTVPCGEVSWEKTVFIGVEGKIVGTTLIQNGVIKVEYTGTYKSKTTSTGTIAAHNATAMECYGWGWGCTPKTSIDACQ